MTCKLSNEISPLDLRKMNIDELNHLAEEIREQLIVNVSRTGGHLASNLGVVELTLAIHYVFLTPRDKIVWDVGHQTYVHKMLTGRLDKMSGLRQYDGISGFPKRDESEHDCFGTGHSSTSISAALGFAAARDLEGDNYSVIAVIGDGALTGGMALEGLNNASSLKSNLIVILNDNEMSIAENVGALAQYLSKIRTAPAYNKGKTTIAGFFNKIPVIGSACLKALDKVKSGIKSLMVPGMLFEDMGLTYLGPIDGHDIGAVINVLQRARSVNGPVIIHALTTKGKGYLPAEQYPDRFHGIGTFDIKSGKSLKAKTAPAYTEIFSKTVIKLAEQQPKLVAITAAMPSGTGLDEFARKYPKRFFDVGIAEQHAVTFAAGMAANGWKPVVAMYSTFLQRAYDQVLHDVCLQQLPVVLAIDRSGIVGEDGATHQGVFEFSFLRSIPGIVIMSPKDENELQHMLKTALSCNGPAVVCYPRGCGLNVQLDEQLLELPVGRAQLLKEGEDLAILTVGQMADAAVRAAEQALAETGISAAVVNMRFVKPLDKKMICSYALKTGKIITVEDHCLCGGFGSAVLELLEEEKIPDVKLKRIGLPDAFIRHGKPQILLDRYGLNVESLKNEIINIVKK